MSYIYEALKRAEDENARGVAATPRALRRAAFFATRPRWWLWALIGILAANAAVLVTLVFFRGSGSPDGPMTAAISTEPGPGPAESPPPGTDAVTPSVPADVAPPAVAAPPATAPPAKTVAPTRPAARAVRPNGEPATRPARPPAPRATPAAPALSRPAPPVPSVDPPPASTPAAIARELAKARPAPPEAPAPAAPVVPGGPAVARSVPAPAPEDVKPPAVETPKLQVQVVVFSDVPTQRMVIIDGRRYAEGGKIDAETVVERITPDGAVVIRGGQRFTLTSGRP